MNSPLGSSPTGIARVLAPLAAALLFLLPGGGSAQLGALPEAAPRVNRTRLAEIEAAQRARFATLQDPRYRALLQTPYFQQIALDPTRTLAYFDHRGRPVIYEDFDVTGAETIGTDQLWPGGSSGYDLDGSTVSIGDFAIWDTGTPRTTHQEFGGRVVVQDGGGTQSHATQVAGMMMASGVDPNAIGMAYAATRLDAYSSGSDYTEMAAAAAAGLQVSNHSYGKNAGWSKDGLTWNGDVALSTTEDYSFGLYDANSVSIDDICFAAPEYLPVWAAGNSRSQGDKSGGAGHSHFSNGVLVMNQFDIHPADSVFAGGYSTVASQTTAKNSLVVGSVGDIAGGYTQPSDVVVEIYSVWGPTDDGRIKPDVVANGAGVYSADSGSDTAYNSSGSGTSFAAPQAAGTVMLLAELFEQTHGKRPLSSTLKAAIINTTDEAGPSDGPDYKHGWGLINAPRAANQIVGSNTTGIFEGVLTDGQTLDIDFAPGAGLADFDVTLCWTDSTGPQDPDSLNVGNSVLVNDLDLRVIKLSGPVFFNPWVLDPANPANAATKGNNSRDNVERVSGTGTGASTYRVRISHKGTLVGGQQAFSLAWRGLQSNASPPTADEISLLQDPADTPEWYTSAGGAAGLFVRAMRDYQLTGVRMDLNLPCVTETSVRIYEWDGAARGAEIASGSFTGWKPGEKTYVIPISATLDACQAYNVELGLGSGRVPLVIGATSPYDAEGNIRLLSGQWVDPETPGGFLPVISFQGYATALTDTVDTTPPEGAPLSSTGAGVFFRALDTVNLGRVDTGKQVAAGTVVTARLYEASGTTRGALLTEGVWVAPDPGGAALALPQVSTGHAPLNHVLVEGEEYEIFLTGGNTDQAQDSDIALPFEAGPFEILGGSDADGNYNSWMSALELVYDKPVAGENLRIGPEGVNTVNNPELHTMEAYYTSDDDRHVYSLGVYTSSGDDRTHTVNVYEATGTSKGSLIATGTLQSAPLPSGVLGTWRDIPVSLDLEAGQDYCFEVVIEAGKIFHYPSQSPFTRNGFTLLSGDPNNSDLLPTWRVGSCATATTTVGIADGPGRGVPVTLSAPFPNPVRADSRVRYTLEREGDVRIRVLDVSGRVVDTLLDGPRPAGTGEVVLDGRNLASGIYFLQLQSGDATLARKISIVN